MREMECESKGVDFLTRTPGAPDLSSPKIALLHAKRPTPWGGPLRGRTLGRARPEPVTPAGEANQPQLTDLPPSPTLQLGLAPEPGLKLTLPHWPAATLPMMTSRRSGALAVSIEKLASLPESENL